MSIVYVLAEFQLDKTIDVQKVNISRFNECKDVLVNQLMVFSEWQIWFLSALYLKISFAISLVGLKNHEKKQ